MFKFMSLQLLAQIDTTLHTASHTFWCPWWHVYSSSIDIFFKIVSGT